MPILVRGLAETAREELTVGLAPGDSPTLPRSPRVSTTGDRLPDVLLSHWSLRADQDARTPYPHTVGGESTRVTGIDV